MAGFLFTEKKNLERATAVGPDNQRLFDIGGFAWAGHKHSKPSPRMPELFVCLQPSIGFVHVHGEIILGDDDRQMLG
jgi:hypothetical protein